MEISYRKAKPTETDAIRSLLEKSELPTESLGTNTTEFFVAESFNKLLGIAGFEFYGDDALLRSVAIQPELQSKGIGSQLVDWMISLAKEREIRKIVLLTETAQKFFERKGFTVVDRSSIVNQAMKDLSEFTGACPISAVSMKLDI
ncbi:GNAT family N-acetyltransferase [bacterium]|nr:MAG: GNAT family N-acetyltransferase [bacterium]